MITVVVSCSMGARKPRCKEDLEITCDGPKELDPQTLKKVIEAEGWIVQFNGSHMDTYCCKTCAL